MDLADSNIASGQCKKAFECNKQIVVSYQEKMNHPREEARRRNSERSIKHANSALRITLKAKLEALKVQESLINRLKHKTAEQDKVIKEKDKMIKELKATTKQNATIKDEQDGLIMNQHTTIENLHEYINKLTRVLLEDCDESDLSKKSEKQSVFEGKTDHNTQKVVKHQQRFGLDSGSSSKKEPKLESEGEDLGQRTNINAYSIKSIQALSEEGLKLKPLKNKEELQESHLTRRPRDKIVGYFQKLRREARLKKSDEDKPKIGKHSIPNIIKEA